jgi:hypothetical protein
MAGPRLTAKQPGHTFPERLGRARRNDLTLPGAKAAPPLIF